MNKFNKGKAIGILAASLSAVSLMGVGFASWVVNGAQGATTGDISVEVAEIQDKRITVSDTSVNGSLIFDAAANDDEGMIHAGTNSKTPSLSFSISYKVSVNAIVTNFKVNAKWTLGEKGTELESAIKNQYLSSPLTTSDQEITTQAGHGTAYTENSDNTTAINIYTPTVTASGSDGTNVYNFTTTFHFAWGIVTGSKNPSLYDDSDEHTNAAVTALNGLKAANGAKFTITLTPAVVESTGK